MFQRGDLQGAIIALKAAIAIAPDFQDAFNNLGAAYGTNNQHKEAYLA